METVVPSKEEGKVVRLLNGAGIKEYVNRSKMDCSKDIGDVLTEKVKALLDAGIKRADSNGRKTLMSKDL